MLRFRRYRVFLVFAVFTLGLIYHFSGSKQWDERWKTSVGLGSSLASSGQAPAAPAAAPDHAGLQKGPIPTPTPQAAPIPQQPTTTAAVAELAPGAVETPAPPAVAAEKKLPDMAQKHINDNFGLSGKGRHEVPPPLPAQTEIHWRSLSEHFPVPTEKLMTLPTGSPVAMPKIQFSFTPETAAEKTKREERLAMVQQAFQFSWNGYKDKAWMKDELRPVSGSSRDPFGGWGATLVDALDTLWIMGLEEEFSLAVDAVAKIDFTTSIRPDIPLFETVIRYLGGLLSAYDVSGAKYDVLLQKATQLGDVLMGAFDTPNRMPETYYYWRPTFAENSHRASVRVVMAELGSMAMEFTRLAQLTGQPKYYDAIARITNEFDIWQNSTKIPGLWPKQIDASGCKKPEYGSNAQLTASRLKGPSPGVVDVGAVNPVRAAFDAAVKEIIPSDTSTFVATPLDRRQIDAAALKDGNAATGAAAVIDPPPVVPADAAAAPPVRFTGQVDCEVQGLASPPGSAYETFTLGGMEDSTYEYLPKQYMLLGGLEPKYRSMYEKASDAATKYLLYRPMIPGPESILAMASGMAQEDVDLPGHLHLDYEQGHLNCFLGGMYGVGAKLFGREKDLEIAKKLTDGCVWAYGATTTGIMPENFQHIPCADMESCAWNQTLWEDQLDPSPDQRQAQYEFTLKLEADAKEAMKLQAAEAAEENARLAKAAAEKAANEAAAVPPLPPPADLEATKASDAAAAALGKRQLGNVDNILPPTLPQTSASTNVAGKTLGAGSKKATAVTPVEEVPETPKFLAHSEYVAERVKTENIPIGMPQIMSRKYILRPEAIESVFIMYRITGDATWREKGWQMFEAVDRATRAEFGHSAILDVTSSQPTHLDEMESFWLAETLKYFYLLFAPDTLISLDEWVLNTEAHPFKRPV